MPERTISVMNDDVETDSANHSAVNSGFSTMPPRMLKVASAGWSSEAGMPARKKAITGSPRIAAEIGRAHVELQSLMRISYAVFCLKKKKTTTTPTRTPVNEKMTNIKQQKIKH